jgi:Ca-activated chloride channel family protein
MIHIAWPWMFLLLPLPLLINRLLPRAEPQRDALFLPFAASVSAGSISVGKSRMSWILLCLVWLLLVGACARPQWLGDPQPVASTGRQMMLAVDVSGSMATPDMDGDLTRLQVVQKVAGDFVHHRHGDQVGLILFGTHPYLQAPLTTDLNTVGQFLNESMIGVAGTETAIGDAIGLGIKRMKSEHQAQNSTGQMIMILLTDGGNDAGMMDPIAAAKMAAQAGLRIYTIGVGAESQQGLFGAGGNTDLDEPTLKAIASITHGEYFRASDADTLEKVYAQIDKLEPSAAREQWYRPSTEWFLWPLALALLLSVPALFIRERS